MAFLDFLESLKEIRSASLAPIKEIRLSRSAWILHNALAFDLSAAQKEHTLHKVSSYWISRFSGLGLQEAAAAYDELVREGALLDDGVRVLVRPIVGEVVLYAKAGNVLWMVENFPKRIEKVGGAGAITEQKKAMQKLFLFRPFWFYEMALAILEYIQPFEQKGLRFWENAKEIADDRYGDLGLAVSKYLALFSGPYEESEWETRLLRCHIRPLEPSLDGAVKAFYEKIESGDICPLRGGKPIRIRSWKKDDERPDDLAQFWRVHEKLEETLPKDAPRSMSELVVVSRKILEYAEAHPSNVLHICSGAPYEVIIKEALSYFEDWPYYDAETRAKADKLISEIAVPRLAKHLDGFKESHKIRFEASAEALERLFGGKELVDENE